jgi:hypothetical protein
MEHPLERPQIKGRYEHAKLMTGGKAALATLNSEDGYFLAHGKDNPFGKLLPGRFLGTAFFCTADVSDRGFWNSWQNGVSVHPPTRFLNDGDLRFWSAKVRGVPSEESLRRGFPATARLSDVHEHSSVEQWRMALDHAMDKAEPADAESLSLARNIEFSLPVPGQLLVTQSLWKSLQPISQAVLAEKRREIVDLEF